MFNVSRATLGVIAVIALVLLVLGLATGIGLFGWLLAIILGAYVVAALVMGRRADAERQVDERDAQPPGATESGAGIRHGQAPSNYVPPVDEGRPPH
jgi:Flp pilus assembly protein TadB